MNNQQQYHVKEKKKQIKDYQSYSAYPGNEGFILHRQSTGGCVRLELSGIVVIIIILERRGTM